jgi:predicted O-linked N-acetylglucosamine transferase (SPINDLY family)
VRLSPNDRAIAAARAEAHERLGRPLLPAGGPLSEREREEIRYRMAVSVTPDNPVALGNLGGALLELGRLEEACGYFRQALKLKPDYFHVWSELLFVINYLGDMPVEAMVEEARRYGAAVAASVPARREHDNDRDPERPLRIGLVSADLRAHPVARFLEAPLAALDRRRITLVAYDVGGRPDAVTERLRPLMSRWHEAAGWSDAQLEAAIRGEAIDILLDLSGHTVGNRLLVFARKPAPIAVTWLGYFATTGLEAIDYVLASPWAIPEGEGGQWVERPWRLPETYLCFSPPRVAVPLAGPPAERNGFVTFGSANALNKLNDATLASWAEVLAAVPRSRLLLRSPPLGDARVAAETRQRLLAFGVAGDRLILDAGVADYGEHLARYNAIDIALDPFPYAGGTTTAEALWMGVPVLTRRGDHYVAHMGENILHNVGLVDWIAADGADYVAKAAGFAADVPALAALRRDLRHRLMRSPVGDAPRFARVLEDAFREMWRRWCAERP